MSALVPPNAASSSEPNAPPARRTGPRRPGPAVRRHRATTALARGLATGGISAGRPVAVALSGGADSTALLVALTALADRPRPPARPALAVHVHHHLRGTDADDDAQHAEALAAELEVPFTLVHAPCADGAGNLLDRAREERERALAGAAGAHGLDVVLAAHHAHDQLESVLMAVGRGGGLDGLAGMPVRRPLAATDDPCAGATRVQLVRPLLAVARDDLRDLCRTAGAAWREDASNADPTRTRARLRRDVLPVLESLWPGVAPRAHRAAAAAAAAATRGDDVLDAALPGRGPWPRDLARRLAVADPDGLARLLRRRAAVAACDLDRGRLVDAVARCARADGDGRSCPLARAGDGGAARLVLRSGELELVLAAGASVSDAPPRDVPLPAPRASIP